MNSIEIGPVVSKERSFKNVEKMTVEFKCILISEENNNTRKCTFSVSHSKA